jgi:hypothetical protein
MERMMASSLAHPQDRSSSVLAHTNAASVSRKSASAASRAATRPNGMETHGVMGPSYEVSGKVPYLSVGEWSKIVAVVTGRWRAHLSFHV